MDFEEDQPLWDGSRQEEEDVYFGKFGYAEGYESPYHPSKPIVCVVLAKAFDHERQIILQHQDTTLVFLPGHSILDKI